MSNVIAAEGEGQEPQPQSCIALPSIAPLLTTREAGRAGTQAWEQGQTTASCPQLSHNSQLAVFYFALTHAGHLILLHCYFLTHRSTKMLSQCWDLGIHVKTECILSTRQSSPASAHCTTCKSWSALGNPAGKVRVSDSEQQGGSASRVLCLAASSLGNQEVRKFIF